MAAAGSHNHQRRRLTEVRFCGDAAFWSEPDEAEDVRNENPLNS